jgi:hypothetical protein
VLQILLNDYLSLKMMSISDLKLYTLNSVAMAISFTNVENTLKIILLLASIVYTIMKTIELIKKKQDDNKGSDS